MGEGWEGIGKEGFRWKWSGGKEHYLKCLSIHVGPEKYSMCAHSVRTMLQNAYMYTESTHM